MSTYTNAVEDRAAVAVLDGLGQLDDVDAVLEHVERVAEELVPEQVSDDQPGGDPLNVWRETLEQ